MPKTTSIKKRVYELKIEIGGDIVFNKPVEVRKQSELNGIANNHPLEVDQIMTWSAKRVR